MTARRDISWRHLGQLVIELYWRTKVTPALVEFYLLGRLSAGRPQPVSPRRRLVAIAWLAIMVFCHVTVEPGSPLGRAQPWAAW